ncbi:MAG: transporter, family, 4-hydroxybenzoate transporter [Acetobacteraceae bacterium]|jgi:MFS transporter, AAHS family, 4-hydroxybenzoate transporter|nr:transporter, family, 4-hydroxybenzoate transporter [Acetobacteraceae bacterium]
MTMLNPALRADALHSPRVSLIASTLCFIVILLDGYDTGVISYTAPMLAHDWNLASAAFTPAFVATSLGAVVGYVSCGALAARFGHRLLVTASVAFFGLMSLATLWATDMTSLTVLRFVTALGLGGAIPTAIALASAHAAANRRERTATIVTVAILVGGTIGGYISVPILQRWGWPGPYVLGGVVPLLLVPTLVAWLPDAPVRGGAGSPAALFAPGLAVSTVLLWAMALLAFMQIYSFTYWLPLLLTSFGFDRASASLGNTYTGMGAIAGVFLMALAVGRVGSARYLAAAFTAGAGLVLLFAWGPLPNPAVPALLVLSGAGLGIGGVGQAAIASMLYPAALRTTGVGWSSAMGRIGSIVGPGIAGFFLHLQWPARDIIAISAVPAFGAAAAALAIFLRTRRGPSPETSI